MSHLFVIIPLSLELSMRYEIKSLFRYKIYFRATPKQERSPTPPAVKIQHRRIRCPECQRFTAETEEKMLRHIRRVHRGENPYQCSMCDYSTYNSAVFEEHVNVHQGIKPFKCAHCPYRSASKKNTKKHELIHRPDNPLKCPHCDFIGRNPRVLTAHNRKVHNNTLVKMFECNLCKKYFDDRELYKKHRHCRFQCKLCNFAACKQSLMTLHRHEEHEHEDEPKLSKQKSRLITTSTFKCASCDWSSNNKPRILLHLIHHPEQTVDESIVDVSILRKLGIMGSKL